MPKIILLCLIFLLTSVSLAQTDTDPIREIPGRIAYIGTDFNVYTLRLHQGETATLTTDGSRQNRYEWPTWSDDGRLAYFCCNSRTTTDVYVSLDGIDPGSVIYSEDGTVFTYAYWSPSGCAGESNCRELGVLLSQLNLGVFSIELVRHLDDGSSTNHRVGLGAPFYFSWSPDAARLLLQRSNRRLEIYDVLEDNTSQLSQRPGVIQAPQWSPVDDRLLFGILGADRSSTDLVISANDEVQVLRSNLNGLVSYNWSPDGNYIAYRTISEGSFSALQIIDSVTSEVIAQPNVQEVFAFFWSPDSKLIAFVTLATPSGSFNASGNTINVSNRAQQTDGLAWAVLEVETGTLRRYGAFVPTSEMIYLLSFFDQFSQSHRIWSPDSTHIVYSELDSAGEAVISVLDMTRRDTVPFFAADGVIGIWSF